jgi:predicted DNA-binding protein (UPF0251 family)
VAEAVLEVVEMEAAAKKMGVAEAAKAEVVKKVQGKVASA